MPRKADSHQWLEEARNWLFLSPKRIEVLLMIAFQNPRTIKKKPLVLSFWDLGFFFFFPLSNWLSSKYHLPFIFQTRTERMKSTRVHEYASTAQDTLTTKMSLLSRLCTSDHGFWFLEIFSTLPYFFVLFWCFVRTRFTVPHLIPSMARTFLSLWKTWDKQLKKEKKIYFGSWF